MASARGCRFAGVRSRIGRVLARADGQPGFNPAADTTGNRRDIAKAKTLQALHGQRRATACTAVDDDGLLLVRQSRVADVRDRRIGNPDHGDGGFDRMHYGLAIAAAAAAVNRRVTLLFSGRAVLALTRNGWRQLDGDPEAAEASLAARHLATFESLLQACAALGVHLLACELALAQLGLGAADLDPAARPEIAGIVTFLNAVPAPGQLLFV